MAVRKLIAEFIGTFALVAAVCGSAMLAYSPINGTPGEGITGIALAVGMTVTAMIYALGPISGAHFNPAVTIALTLAKRFQNHGILPYIIAQTAGGTAAAILFWVLLKNGPGIPEGFASNGYGQHSIGNFSLIAAFLCEVTITAIFIITILAITKPNAPHGFAPIAIGCILAALHFVALPITGASLNPARSTATALIEGGWALKQLWLFWIAPIAGAFLGTFIFRSIDK